MGVKRILVGTDGSEHAQRAVRWAADLAAQTGAEVVATHAVGLLVTTPEGQLPSTSLHDHLRKLLEGDWTEELRIAGVAVNCRLVEGSAVTALLRAAEEESADLVVVGSRGAGGFSDLHLGSTSHQVALYADRPVTIIPPPGRPLPPPVTGPC
jgi:nucleotide-binding universal stress UspA family protein